MVRGHNLLMLLPERRNEALISYIEAMPLKPIELPPRGRAPLRRGHARLPR
jgi:hypothetical protein